MKRQTPMMYRAAKGSVVGGDPNGNTVNLAFSSEEPVLRYDLGDGMVFHEVLDHSGRNADLSELNNGAPLLDGHDGDTIGVVESARIDPDKVGRAVTRFSKNQRPQELFQDVVDGIRTKVSFGYSLTRELERIPGKNKGDPPTRRFAWKGREVSLVPLAADNTVGPGRSEDRTQTFETEVLTMDDNEVRTDDNEVQDVRSDKATVLELNSAAESAKQKERENANNILVWGKQLDKIVPGALERAHKAIANGEEFETFRAALDPQLLEAKQVREKDMPTYLGMSDGDTRKYSIVRAIRAMDALRLGKKPEKESGHEIECSNQISKDLDREPKGMFVPLDVRWSTPVPLAYGQRVTPPLNTTDTGSLVGTDHLAGSFIEALRPLLVTGRAGMTTLPGLVGNVDIPKQAGVATWTWLGEDDTQTDSDVPMASVTLTPTTASGMVSITRRLVKQSSPAVESLIRNDLVRGAAETLDVAGLEGSGTANQPTGIVNQVGIGTTSFASLGAPSYLEVIAQETDVAESNALRNSPVYVTTPTVAGNMKGTTKDAGSGQFVLGENGQANGYPVLTTTQLTANTMLFGDYSQLLMGMWGVLDLSLDLATKAASGGIVLRAFQDVDFAVRHAQAFNLGSGGT